MTDTHPQNLQEYKIKASILLKNLRSEDRQKALSAAPRFQRLPQLAGASPGQILNQRDQISRKHALAVIAMENGFTSWVELKNLFERIAKQAAIRDNNKYTPLYPRRCAGFINAWYRSYEEAREHFSRAGGYLLPYRSHFFVCERVYIEALGMDPDDPDWARIGWDWVKSADLDAWGRLDARLQTIDADRAL